MLADLLRPREARSQFPNLSQQSYLNQLSELMRYNGNVYRAGALDHRAAEFATGSAPVSAALHFRVSVFSEATFKFQPWVNGRPGNLFGTPDLMLLEKPWPGAGTSHLLAAVESDVSVYGNSYWVKVQKQLVRLDPKCVQIAWAEVYDPTGMYEVGDQLIGYTYQEQSNEPAVFYLPEEVAHVHLLPDPLCPHRGTSWLRAVLSDVDADLKMTGYKQALLDNSAVPGLILKAEAGVTEEQFTAARDALRARNTGWDKVGRTLLLGAGFDATVVGQSMQQLDMKAMQGAGESRIAAASGVSPVLLGFSEGLQGSSLNTGNYGAARRRFADGTLRPLWRSTCTAFETLVPPPPGSRLWVNERDVSFLQEDVKDAADIKSTEALTIESLVRAGFEPMSAVQAVSTGDYGLLVHTGLYSVQLQPPGAGQPPARALEQPAEARQMPVTGLQPAEMHIHLPETAQVEIRQDEMFGALERIAERQVTTAGLAEAVSAGVSAAIKGLPASVHTHNVSVEHQPIPVQMAFEMPAPVVNVAPSALVQAKGKRTVKFMRDGDGNVTGATMVED